ncbi:MAG: 2Fe-2S iron-sulfur cluster-binding protein [Rhodospirillaceae bacterium]
MANVYFTSPTMAKNIKVEAVAGTGTMLELAQNNNVHIPSDCENGECGSCVIRVIHLDGDRVKAVSLTDKEKDVLHSVGKLSVQEKEKIENTDLPPTYRLACQYIPTDEDVLVAFSGDPGGS